MRCLTLRAKITVALLASPLTVIADPYVWVHTRVDGDLPTEVASPSGVSWMILDEQAGETRDRWGVALPTGDPLADVRSALPDALERFYRGGPVVGRRLIEPLARRLLDAPLDMATHAENRSSRVDAACALARIELEQRHRDAATAVLRALLLAEPQAVLEPVIVPPEVRRLAEQVRGSLLNAPRGALQVRTPDPSCHVFVEARDVGSGVVLDVPLSEGRWSVYARCGSRATRMRTVTIAQDQRVVVTLDPRIDAATAIVGTSVLLRYGAETEARSTLVGDLAAIGAGLHAQAVATRWQGHVIVVGVEGRALSAVVSTGDDAALREALRTPATGQVLQLPTQERAASRVDPRTHAQIVDRRRSAGAWPWVVAGFGVASLGLGAVLYVARTSREGDIEADCPATGEERVCDPLRTPDVDAIGDFEMGRIVALSVGGVLVLGGVLWWLLDTPNASSRSTQTTSWTPYVGTRGAGIAGRF